MRRVVGFVLALLTAAFWAAPALAQSGPWSPFPLDEDVTKFARGPGFYLNLVKLGLLFVLILLWARTSDWVNMSSTQHKLGYRKWNSIMVFPFAVAFIAFWIIPTFWGGFPLMALTYLIPFITYVVVHNKSVSSSADKVFTGEHLSHWFAEKMRVVGGKGAKERKDPRDAGAPVVFTPKGGPTPQHDQANLLTARQSPGFVPAKDIIADCFSHRGDAVMLDYTADAVAVRFMVDGVWHPAEGRDRETGDAMLAVFKLIAGLKPEERRARQVGMFGMQFETYKYPVRITSVGTETGERVLLQFVDETYKKRRLHDIGMRQKMQDDFKEILSQKIGLIILSAPPGNGLTTLLHATVGTMDRYMRSFVAVEDVDKRELDIENVPVTTFNTAAGEDPALALKKLIREYPDVFVIPDMVDAQSAEILALQAGGERMVLTTIRAKEAPEAVLRVMQATKVAPATLVAPLAAVVNQRNIRKLCNACKEPYAPPAEILQRLGLPPGRVEAFYQPRVPTEEQKEICPECAGVGYVGRTAIYELLVPDDAFKQAAAKSPRLDVVRQAARKAGMRTLQEEGIVLVVKGITSLPELMRVLKE